MTSAIAEDGGRTGKFREKRDRIIDAAAAVINEKGVRGLTFADVAKRVGLSTTSVTYYFRRKDELAEAALNRSLDQLERLVATAAACPSPQDRIAEYISMHVDARARVQSGKGRELTVLSDIRALDDEYRQGLTKRYSDILRLIRSFFGSDETDRQKDLNAARSHALIECMLYLPAWLQRYSVSDLPRVNRRLADVMTGGVGQPGAIRQGLPIKLAPEKPDDAGLEDFMRAATTLINQQGYKGAHVDLIAAELNVTKGSFYHHIEGKDDLVFDCFRRSYRRIADVQRSAIAAGGSHWQQLVGAIDLVLRIQMTSDEPLLRITALQALPRPMRIEIVERSNRVARRFAGMIMDAVTEGGARPVDPLIAAQILMAQINAASELKNWAARQPEGQAVRDYRDILLFGLIDGGA